MARRDNQRTFQDLPEQKMAAEHNEVPLNAIRVFVTIAREGSVTRAASTLGTTQSSVSRYLAVLQDYFGTDLVQRRGRRNELTESSEGSSRTRLPNRLTQCVSPRKGCGVGSERTLIDSWSTRLFPPSHTPF